MTGRPVSSRLPAHEPGDSDRHEGQAYRDAPTRTSFASMVKQKPVSTSQNSHKTSTEENYWSFNKKFLKIYAVITEPKASYVFETDGKVTITGVEAMLWTRSLPNSVPYEAFSPLKAAQFLTTHRPLEPSARTHAFPGRTGSGGSGLKKKGEAHI